jgi:plasmid maintenance system antidote protein VapI
MSNDNIKPISPGDALRSFKEELKLTNYQLAEKLGVNESTIRSAIKGRTTLTDKMAKKLASLNVEGKDYNYWTSVRKDYASSNSSSESENEVSEPSEDD